MDRMDEVRQRIDVITNFFNRNSEGKWVTAETDLDLREKHETGC